MRRAIGVAVAMALAGAAQAGPAPERLVMTPFPGAPWTRITDQMSEGGGWNHEAIPPGETEGDFTQILADQAFPGLKGFDPVDFLKQRFAQDALACDGVRSIGPTQRDEGGFRVVYGQIYCAQQRGRDYGAHVFFKVIIGDAALYAVTLNVRTPASSTAGVLSFPPGREADMQALLQTESAADRYVAASVYLCGGRSTDARCGK